MDEAHDASMMVSVWEMKHKGIGLRFVVQATLHKAEEDDRLRALEMVDEIESIFDRSELGVEFTEGIADLIVEQEKKL
jgi:hypothetical protein